MEGSLVEASVTLGAISDKAIGLVTEMLAGNIAEIRYPRASPWHFITQASLDLNPGVPGTQRTSVSSLLQFQP